MNILYLSHLSGAPYAGPTYSVPKQIEAQSKIDNVFWYNAVMNDVKEWKTLPYYHDLSEYPQESIYALPEPFNHPDIIIVELFYNMAKSNLRKELVSGNIPYVIVPRGELTKQAQKRKALKKKIANLFLFKQYARKAAAIQYLTNQEYYDSGDNWNTHHFVVPNGIYMPTREKAPFHKDQIKCISIGRIEPYQKGLDILIDACCSIKELLIKSRCTISIYGPDKEGKLSELLKSVQQKKMEEIIHFYDPVYGKDKEEILANSDVFIIPSRFEGHPMALIEAMSYGLPCIATRGSNMKDEIEEYNAGWTAENNIESLKEAIEKMILSRSFEKIGKNARELSQNYNWDTLAVKTNHLLRTYMKGAYHE